MKSILGGIVVVVIAGSAILGYQYYAFRPKAPLEKNNNALPKEEADFSKLDKDILLKKIFPPLTFENGKADLPEEYSSLNLYLKDSIEDYFLNAQEKSLLLIVQLDGAPHAVGLYHAYLGLFDKNGNLLTPASSFPTEDLFQDKSHFGADEGKFGFFGCKGIKYILFVASSCPNGTCCSDSSELLRVGNGQFEKFQDIDESSLDRDYGIRMKIYGNDLMIKKVPLTADERNCSEINYKELRWDSYSCRFD